MACSRQDNEKILTRIQAAALGVLEALARDAATAQDLVRCGVLGVAAAAAGEWRGAGAARRLLETRCL